jgi:hypothetical protein
MQAVDFTTDALAPTWAVASAILKGDLPGHEFHGNQWTSRRMSIKAQALALAVRDGGVSPKQLAKEHDELAQAHLDRAQELERTQQNPFDQKERAFRLQSANAHYDAANAHSRAEAMLLNKVPLGGRTPVADSSAQAADASIKADRIENQGLTMTEPMAA